GGQTAIKLTKALSENNIAILGTSAEGIDIAEDRERFDSLLEKFGIRRPKGMGVSTLDEAISAAKSLGFPVLLRPSYVIGGQNMKIVHDESEVRIYMERILSRGIDNPVLVDKYMMGTELEVDVISDGRDVLIPGIMEHIERAGVHSGDSIAVYPPFSINDKMLRRIADCSEKLALALGTKGLVNIQYLIYEGELYVIEVNPRASRTVPYISKVTGVPMVDIASEVMVGHSLKTLGYGTGMWKIPPYYAVKVPVFSFEKLTDANSYLGPEMKSTGEVLGIGRSLNEALFKGIAASGKHLKTPFSGERTGVFISVDTHDQLEIVSLAKKLDDLGFDFYATRETACSIRSLGIDVTEINGISDNAFSLLESGKISFVVYTGALMDSTVEDYIALSRKALTLSIPCFTSLDTANAAADIIRSRFNLSNTELVDINHMQKEERSVEFCKMQATGDDYIFIDNRNGQVECPQSLCIAMCDRHCGIGGDGLVTIENSACADIKMRVFNCDGSEGQMAGNSIRSLAKYLYDNKIVVKDEMTVETASGIKRLGLYTRNGKVTYVSVDMGKADFSARSLPAVTNRESLIDSLVTIGGRDYNVTCLSVGNPHCVVFTESVDKVDMEKVGPQFENAPMFPERINTEFVRVVNKNTLKMRVYERGNGETPACGTGACAAAAAAVKNGFCKAGEDITVKMPGGDLIVSISEQYGIILSGDTKLVYTGKFKF
ncbi:MAG: diaminopimelate epimerase, partial [Acutalibacteraceae bacterium]